MWRYYLAAIAVFAVILGASALLTGTKLHAVDQSAYAADAVAPELIGKPADWINTDGKALQLFGAAGVLKSDPYDPKLHSVVLVDFWEYTCVNCIRTLPYVKDWAARYKNSGLVVIGIHTPEFSFAHDKANVQAAVKRFGITYPVLVDSDYENWNAFENQFWPMKYVIDDKGKIVFTHPGEGGYEDTENRLRELLLAANPGETLPQAYGDHSAVVKSSGPVYDMTGELYAGSDKVRLQNQEGSDGTSFAPIAPSGWIDGQLVVSGQWKFTTEYVQHVGSDSEDAVSVKYHARDAVAVIKPMSQTPFKAYVTQDGKPVAQGDAGADLKYEPDGRSYLLIDSPREYQVTHNRMFGAHTLSIMPGSNDFRLYSFDFAAT